MVTHQSVEPLRAQISLWRNKGQRIAFVPTMGNLHDGHLSLVELAKQHADRVVVSIYVNPLQFAPDEDFASYPRTLEEDMAKLEVIDVDLVFIPHSEQIYPEGEHASCFVEVPVLSHIIEGEFRPGFFRGVATVVLKLFNLVQPDIAVFGEKDYQQLMIIRQMVTDLCLPIEIIGGTTRREPDWLAMSSRNTYLTAEEREKSVLLSLALKNAKQQIDSGSDFETVEAESIMFLSEHGFKVDYVTVREASTLKKVSGRELDEKYEVIILAAARIGTTRLIDNIKLTPDIGG